MQIEAERRATEQYKAELEKAVQRERALAEAEGRAAERRKNEDIYRRELAQKLEEDRKRLVEAINTTFSNLGAALGSLLTGAARGGGGGGGGVRCGGGGGAARPSAGGCWGLL